ncbi:unnamed protein product [Ranitomeya imitator]|uniref:Protein N-terminal glutamine amidohydrolase n=1 Tax=Ranitomeya imitator TaxID=111125 RepID=A0ABN9KS17_9NEOB|nr:unnamed protein product [Ranitomeya imitator]
MQAAASPPPVLADRRDCCYTSCYCEENVWKLCESIRERTPGALPECYTVFLSNDHRMIPIWRQKCGDGEDPVIWDYHVILLHDAGSDGQRVVYDLDTVLPFPCPCDAYIKEALRSDDLIRKDFRRKTSRPLLNPSTEFAITTSSGKQFQILTALTLKQMRRRRAAAHAGGSTSRQHATSGLPSDVQSRGKSPVTSPDLGVAVKEALWRRGTAGDPQRRCNTPASILEKGRDTGTTKTGNLYTVKDNARIPPGSTSWRQWTQIRNDSVPSSIP